MCFWEWEHLLKNYVSKRKKIHSLNLQVSWRRQWLQLKVCFSPIHKTAGRFTMEWTSSTKSNQHLCQIVNLNRNDSVNNQINGIIIIRSISVLVPLWDLSYGWFHWLKPRRFKERGNLGLFKRFILSPSQRQESNVRSDKRVCITAYYVVILLSVYQKLNGLLEGYQLWKDVTMNGTPLWDYLKRI